MTQTNILSIILKNRKGYRQEKHEFHTTWEGDEKQIADGRGLETLQISLEPLRVPGIKMKKEKTNPGRRKRNEKKREKQHRNKTS